MPPNLCQPLHLTLAFSVSSGKKSNKHSRATDIKESHVDSPTPRDPPSGGLHMIKLILAGTFGLIRKAGFGSVCLALFETWKCRDVLKLYKLSISAWHSVKCIVGHLPLFGIYFYVLLHDMYLSFYQLTLFLMALVSLLMMAF